MKSDSGNQLDSLQRVFKRCLLFFILILFTQQVVADNTYIPQDGDIIFQESNLVHSNVMKLVTKSPYTHIGIIFYVNNMPYVYEAANTVRYTKLTHWIARGKNQWYVVKRLKDNSKLTRENIKLLKKEAKKYEGKSYDVMFDWSDKQIYCSELVWKIYYGALAISLGELEKLRDMDLSSPHIQKEISKRYGNITLTNEAIITPAAIFASKHLITVAQ